jgi:hypothetical protein
MIQLLISVRPIPAKMVELARMATILLPVIVQAPLSLGFSAIIVGIFFSFLLLLLLLSLSFDYFSLTSPISFWIAACTGTSCYSPSGLQLQVGVLGNLASYPLRMTGGVDPLPSYASMRVWVTVPHVASGDLAIILTDPNQNSLYLTLLNGMLISNVYNGVYFQDNAPVFVNSYIFNEGFVPTVVPSEYLANFRGENFNGLWTLTVVDIVGGDSGYLDQWGIEFDCIPMFFLSFFLHYYYYYSLTSSFH